MRGASLLACGMMVLTAPVHAKEPTKEIRWAQCLWESVPKSAANWLAMPDEKTEFGATTRTPRELLEYRLQAACFDKLTPQGKKFPIDFAPKKVRAALELSKPASVGPDAIDPKAYQCTRYFRDDAELKNPAALKWGFGEFETGHAFASVSYVFATKGGGGVGLPETGGVYKCKWIKEDGSLVDA